MSKIVQCFSYLKENSFGIALHFDCKKPENVPKEPWSQRVLGKAFAAVGSLRMVASEAWKGHHEQGGQRNKGAGMKQHEEGTKASFNYRKLRGKFAIALFLLTCCGMQSQVGWHETHEQRCRSAHSLNLHVPLHR